MLSIAPTRFRRLHGAELPAPRRARRLIQVVAGARQVGKTTLVEQVTSQSSLPVRYASADALEVRADAHEDLPIQ